MWVPDLAIVNRVPSEWTDGTTDGKAKIFYTGRDNFTRQHFMVHRLWSKLNCIASLFDPFQGE